MAQKPTKPKKRIVKAEEPAQKRSYLKQSDVPAASLEEALRIPEAMLEHYAGKPTLPLHLAKALNVDPNGSQLKVLTGAAMAFGLTEGGAQAAAISITDLAKRILRPTTEGQADVAKREAVLAPRVFREFLTNYNGHSFPRPDLAINVLEGMGVPRNKAAEVLDRIETSARAVGYLTEIKGKFYLSLGDKPPPQVTVAPEPGKVDLAVEEEHEEPATTDEPPRVAAPIRPPVGGRSSIATAIADDERRRNPISAPRNFQVPAERKDGDGQYGTRKDCPYRNQLEAG